MRLIILTYLGLVIFSSGILEADPCAPLPPANTPGFQDLLQNFLDANCHKDWVHDARVRTTNGVHPQVQVYFSPSMWDWLTKNNRQGNVPDGAIVIKQQYGFGTSIRAITDWAVMVRDSTSAADGWYWADLAPKGGVQVITDSDCDEATYPAAEFGMYCINCHASAVNGQNTYATTQFVNPLSGHSKVLKDSGAPPNLNDDIHYRLSHLPRRKSASPSTACMVPESSDHVTAEGKGGAVHRLVTSDQCAGCHNATGTLTPARTDLPSMLFYKNNPGSKPATVNLSPNGEWRFSMMGLAGRDPIFFSQLNSEITLHDNLADQPGHAKEFVQDLCLSCHGVAGQRQFHMDNAGQFFTRDQLNDPNSEYGALGREGISCAICHRIAPDGLGTPGTYTGRFKLNDGSQLNGPYNDVITLPMQNALNVEPVQGSQITGSALCGSCHTIILPVYRANGQPVIDSVTGKQKTFTEQATFYEWQNSDFRDGGPTPQSCQQCHMPDFYLQDGVSVPLSYKIANIEDNTFPAVEHRASDPDITLKTRDGYRRHLLLGINLFALEMFKQFRNELGLYEDDPMLRPSLNTDKGIDTAIDTSGNMIAKLRTADVTIESVTAGDSQLAIDVRVTNKAGHSFPSGVGFRRAFLNLQIMNGNGNVVWASGSLAKPSSTHLKGLIVDGAGQPLVTETFTPAQQTFQPHYWTGNPITRQDQVQIYEELVRNPEGFLTTSFIALNQKVKDNRLQPKGWSATGVQAAETQPVGVCTSDGHCDPQYSDGSGSNVVRYIVPTEPGIQGVTVRVTLYYQTIPPYYQLQRASDASGVDTDRLVRFAQNLNVGNTPISNWALPITSDTINVSITAAGHRSATLKIKGPNELAATRVMTSTMN